MNVLVTRPQRDGESTARQLAARGHKALLAPVLETAGVDAALPPGNFEALIATSAHAFEFLPRGASERFAAAQLHVVGARTHAAAIEAGFANVGPPAPDAAALSLRLGALAPQKFLYLAGRDRASLLETELVKAGHEIAALVVYEARPIPALSRQVIDALREGEVDAVLHYSARSGSLFIQAIHQAGLTPHLSSLRHIAISDSAAEPLRQSGLSVRIAPTPDSIGLFSQLDSV